MGIFFPPFYGQCCYLKGSFLTLVSLTLFCIFYFFLVFKHLTLLQFSWRKGLLWYLCHSYWTKLSRNMLKCTIYQLMNTVFCNRLKINGTILAHFLKKMSLWAWCKFHRQPNSAFCCDTALWNRAAMVFQHSLTQSWVENWKAGELVLVYKAYSL